MMMFTEHANVLAEKKHSKIAGKYETAILPGESARGGWSLGDPGKFVLPGRGI